MGRLRHCVLAPILVLAACSRPSPMTEISVVAVDYAFQAPDSVAPGEVAVSFRNAGTKLHEVKVIALRPGVAASTALPLAMIDSGWSELREPTGGILTAASGKTTPGRLLINFQSGRTYLLVCSFADSDSAPLHSELGMIKPVVVK